MSFDNGDISYVEINKRRRGDLKRQEGDKLVNRMTRPKVKKIYVKRNGEDIYEKPKLFVWRQWQSPKLEQLLEDVGPYVGLDDGAEAIYSIDGDQITDPEEIQDLSTYFITGEEPLLPIEQNIERKTNRYTSLSAPEYYTSNSVRSTYPSGTVPATPPPRPYTTTLRKNTTNNNLKEYDEYFDEAVYDTKQNSYKKSYSGPNFDFSYDENPRTSEFDNDETIRRDREALEKHKQKHLNYSRRESNAIFNRRDQTHPDAYIIYVFLNGAGMECQYMNFQRKQLEKGMNYVLELIARRYNINPQKLVDMDGKKIREVTQLMSRGAYVIIPVGQSFRDTWYFLPDNAIDTSSNKHMVDERSAQRDRLLQRRLKKENLERKTRSKSRKPQQQRQQLQSTNKIEFRQSVPNRKF
ncbi:unnamed protein product [Caenorhabditis angaria]|uniref:Doublecortin domain-containing protein n=1 Tax=Caenorhabditis angaria TaxID=860376 RepID=A0A9P1IC25_9PELO|nr:unnamed protein product [Caenorhabditis angaria]